MRRLAFDIETNGLLPEMDTIHCINAIDLDSGAELRFNNYEFYPDAYTGELTDVRTNRTGSLEDGVRLIESNCEAWAHNGLGFDFPVLEQVGKADLRETTKRDSKTAAALIWAEIKDLDRAAQRKGKLPDSFFKGGNMGKHTLKAWGLRLGEEKLDFNPKDYGHSWESYPFSKDADDYCMQDVRTLVKLIELIMSKGYSPESIQLEHDVQRIISRQEAHGWLFDSAQAQRLTSTLQQRSVELHASCEKLYPAFYTRDGARTFKPKRSNSKMGYVAGAEFTKVKLIDFNPASRQHIADRLIKVDGWEPTEVTKTGLTKVDETILEALPFPSAKQIAEYMMVGKRLGQVAEGKEAWLKKVKKDGRIYGRVHTNGTVTGRMAHFSPNIGQVPKNSSPYGAECRGLFIVPEGKLLTGCDADGLELRMMAHYLFPYDKGALVNTITSGGSMHTRNQASLEFNSRDLAKTFFYAMLYGAGDFKLGTTVIEDFDDDKRTKFYLAYPPGVKRQAATVRLGRNRRARLIDGITGMKQLLAKLKQAVKAGSIRGLDGRRVHIRSAHSALNTLFQSAGAIVMKQALVICDDTLAKAGHVPGENYEFVGNIHDEFQIECDREIAHDVGKIAAQSIVEAGLLLGLRCPLAGNFDVGSNWAETH